MYFITDAREAIVGYSTNLRELLSRQKLTRNILFQYLAAQKILVDIKATKNTLIDALLKHWATTITKKVNFASHILKEILT